MRVTRHETEDGSEFAKVSIVDAEDDGTVITSLINRGHYRGEKQFRKAIVEAVKDDLHWVGKTVVGEQLVLPELQPDTGTEVNGR